MKKLRGRTLKVSPPQLLIILYLLLAAIGTILLKLPYSTSFPISWLDSFFTVTSAFTVTGLVVVDTSAQFSLFGELIILLLIQIGGIGYMSIAVLVYLMLGKKIGLRERLLLQNSLNVTSVGGIIRLSIYVCIFSFSLELIGAVLLSFTWIPEFGFIKGVYYSVFHSVSAFNNAGFSLFPNNLMNYVGNPLVNFVIPFLIILGGIGFSVIVDILKKRRFHKLTLHSKFMLVGTVIMIVFGMLFFFIIEYNKLAFNSFSLSEKIFASFFQTVTLRTAGFNTIHISELQDGSLVLMIIYMFIGGGSGSTAGGIKLTTFFLIVFSVFNYCRGKTTISVFNRTIRQELVIKSLAISMVALTFIFTAIFILSITEDKQLIEIVFEVFSAFGTVGLTLNLTPYLTGIGKVIICCMMFIGKIGPLSLVLSLSFPHKNNIKYPTEDVIAG